MNRAAKKTFIAVDVLNKSLEGTMNLLFDVCVCEGLPNQENRASYNTRTWTTIKQKVNE